jgi:hypothetical protein
MMPNRPNRVAALAGTAFVALVATACGGRVHVEDDTGSRYRRVIAMQRDATPRKSVAPATAAEVKLATHNRMIRLSADGSANPISAGDGGGYSAGAGAGAGGTGSTSLNFGPATGEPEIRIQGK